MMDFYMTIQDIFLFGSKPICEISLPTSKPSIFSPSHCHHHPGAFGGGIAAVGKEELVWERVRLGFSSSSTILSCRRMGETKMKDGSDGEGKDKWWKVT